ICLFDQDTQRFFHVVLTLDRAAPTTQNLSGRNHLDIAVSDTSNPAGTWTTFVLPVQNDGSEGTPNHKCTGGPCLGDYPHIGADAVFSNTFTSTDLVVWTVSNTRSIDSASPALALNTKTVAVEQYGGPVPKADQKSGSLPLRDCIADTGTPTRARCGLIIGSGAVRNFNAARLDTNDTRMQQVTFAKGKLWGALDTAVSVGGVVKAGIAFFVL